MSPTLLFVHSPVVGPTTWSAAADVLRGKGFCCLVPDLTGVATSGPPHYPKLARAAVPLRELGAPPACGGLLDIADAGRLPPWNEWFPANAIEELVPQPNVRRQFIAEIPQLPLAYFLERAPVTPSWDTLQFAYMRFSSAYDRTADDAERLGWWVVRRDWDHLRMLTAPVAVADLIAQAFSATLDE